MAKDVGNLRTRLSFEKTGDSNLTDLSRDLKGVRSEMNNFRSSGRAYRTSVKGMRQESDILTRRLQVQRERVAELKRRYDEAKRTTGENSARTKDLAAQYNNAQAQMKMTEQQLERLNRIIKTQESRWTKLGQRMESSGKMLQSIGKRTTEFGRAYSMRVTAPIVAAGVAAIKVGMDFEEGMSKVQAISGATGAELEEMRDQAKDLGESTRYSARQAADGMEFLARAGWKTQDIMSGMPGVLDLAASSNMDLGRAADIASNIMSGFSIEADRAGYVADVLAHAAANANTDVEQMGEAMKYAAPVANTLGLDIEGTAAAIMGMSDAGLQGSIAGRAFATSLSKLSNPTDTMQKQMKELEIDFFDAQGAMKPLPEIVGDLEKSMSDYTPKQQSAALATLFGSDAMKQWSVLVDQGSEKLAENTKELQNSEGAAEEMAKIMQDNAKGAMVEFRSALEGAGIAASEHVIPAITDITKKATDLIRKFGELDEDQQKQILKWLALAAAVGPTAIVLGQATTAFGGVLRVGGSISTMLGRVGGAGLIGRLGLLGGPAGIAVLAGAGVGYLGYKIYDAYKESKKLYDINLDVTQSLSDQHTELSIAAESYDELRRQSHLTTEEFGELLDVRMELSKNPEGQALEELQVKYEELKEKSGLTNKELDAMIKHNETIVKNAPHTADAHTEQGNAIADVNEKLEKYLEVLQEASLQEIEMERMKFEENKLTHLENINKAKEEELIINDKLVMLSDFQKMSDIEREERYWEVVEAQSHYLTTEEEIVELKKEEELLQMLLSDGVVETIDGLKEQLETQKGIIEENELELEKAEELDSLYAEIHLKKLGINEAGQKGIDLAEEQLEKLKEEVSDLEEIIKAQGDYNGETSEQIRLKQDLIGEHEEILRMLNNETEYQSDHIEQIEKKNRKLEGSGLIYIDNQGRVKRIGIEQDITNKKIGEGILFGRDLTKELSKSTEKDVNVDDAGSAKKVTDEASKSVTKKVSLSASWLNLGSAISTMTSRVMGALPGFAKGTNFAPGGPAWVGEEGFELARLGNQWSMLDFGLANIPRGTEIFTHDESKSILRSLNNIPAYAGGVSSPGEANRVVGKLNQSDRAVVNNENNIVVHAVIRSDEDINKLTSKLDQTLSELGNRKKAAWGG